MENSGFMHEGVRVLKVATQRIWTAPGARNAGNTLERVGGAVRLNGLNGLNGLSSAAFTLFELCLAVAIGVLILGLAVPSLRSVFADQNRNAVYEQFDELVRRAQRVTVEERRDCRLVWWRDAIVLVAEGGGDTLGMGVSAGQVQGELGRVGIGRGEVYALERPHAMLDKPPMEWPFWVGGTCEPVVVSYEGASGRWKAVFDGLTCRGRLVGEELR
ncbi:MAG: hypothetical protein RLZZ253_1039 [Verrucomicrobiota bacterium]|jgi:hypothetical protein